MLSTWSRSYIYFFSSGFLCDGAYDLVPMFNDYTYLVYLLVVVSKQYQESLLVRSSLLLVSWISRFLFISVAHLYYYTGWIWFKPSEMFVNMGTFETQFNTELFILLWFSQHIFQYRSQHYNVILKKKKKKSVHCTAPRMAV